MEQLAHACPPTTYLCGSIPSLKDGLDISLIIQGMPIEHPHDETKEVFIGYPHAAIMKIIIDRCAKNYWEIKLSCSDVSMAQVPRLLQASALSDGPPRLDSFPETGAGSRRLHTARQ